MKRAIALLGILGVAAVASALSAYTAVFNATYNEKGSAGTRKLACQVCHANRTGGPLNPYGVDIQKALQENNTVRLTVVVLRKVESLDSDKDGTNNLKEIQAGRHPGKKG